MDQNPILFEQLALARLDDLRREAAAARMHAGVRRRRNVARGSMRAVGSLLIALGTRLERIASRGTVVIGHQAGS